MILADSSAWIDYLNDGRSAAALALDAAVLVDEIVVGDLVKVEVLQGIRDEREFRSARLLLSRFRMVTLCGPEIAERAAQNYRALRRNGITIRGTIDVIIATWCIENDARIIRNDRDLAAMEVHLALLAYG